MDKKCAHRLTRISKYFYRICTDFSKHDRTQALADTAELHYQVGQLYRELEALKIGDETELSRDQF